MLLDGATKDHTQNIKSLVILGSAHLETNCMQLLHKEEIDPILEHHLLKIMKCIALKLGCVPLK